MLQIAQNHSLQTNLKTGLLHAHLDGATTPEGTPQWGKSNQA